MGQSRPGPFPAPSAAPKLGDAQPVLVGGQDQGGIAVPVSVLPCRSGSRIRRATVQRATLIPSRPSQRLDYWGATLRSSL